MALADVPVQLITACQHKDRQSIERLLRLISPDIYRIVYSQLRDHDDTDEVVQETLIRIFRYIHALKEPERFSSWTMRIAVNQVQTWRMKKGRRRHFEVSDSVELEDGVVDLGFPAGPTPRDEAIRSEMRDEIEQAVATLPDRQRMAVSLFELEGLSIRQVADAMRCSEGAVKFNIHEARKKLQQRLGHLVRGIMPRQAEPVASKEQGR